MADSDELRATINSWERKYEDAKDENDRLDAKIKTLEEAREYLRSAKRSAQQLKDDVKGYEADGTWKGKKRNSLDGALEGTLANEVGNLVSAIDAAEEEVSGYIWQYRLDKNWFVEIMEGAENAIEGIYRELSDLVD